MLRDSFFDANCYLLNLPFPGMEEIVAAYTSLIFALLIVWIIYEKRGFRVVSLSIPLLASFSFIAPDAVPVIIVSSIASYIAGELAYRKLLFYGMRIFLLNSTVSSILVFVLSLNRLDVGYLLLSTLPGLLAYDVHASRDPIMTITYSAIFFTVQFALTVMLVNFLR